MTGGLSSIRSAAPDEHRAQPISARPQQRRLFYENTVSSVFPVFKQRVVWAQWRHDCALHRSFPWFSSSYRGVGHGRVGPVHVRHPRRRRRVSRRASGVRPRHRRSPGRGPHRSGLRQRPAPTRGRPILRRLPGQLPRHRKVGHRPGRHQRRRRPHQFDGPRLPQHQDGAQRLLPGRSRDGLCHLGRRPRRHRPQHRTQATGPRRRQPRLLGRAVRHAQRARDELPGRTTRGHRPALPRQNRQGVRHRRPGLLRRDELRRPRHLRRRRLDHRQRSRRCPPTSPATSPRSYSSACPTCGR